MRRSSLSLIAVQALGASQKHRQRSLNVLLEKVCVVVVLAPDRKLRAQEAGLGERDAMNRRELGADLTEGLWRHATKQ